jgi:hypothetical protein
MKQNHYIAEFKKVIGFAEEMSKLAVQWCYELDETNIMRSKKQKEQLKSCCSKRKTFGGSQHGCHHALEIMLNDFITNQCNSCLPANAKIIEVKVHEITCENCWIQSKLALGAAIYEALEIFT